MRKTISMVAVLNRANTFLATSDDEQTGERQGVIGFVEALLHDTDTYAGFAYLSKAGLVRHTTRNVTVEDETRRSYYTKQELLRGN